MEIREGYKKTEIGVIPEDWEAEAIEKEINVFRGGSPRPIQNYITTAQDGVNWIKIGDVGVGAKYIDNTEEKIKPEGISRSRMVTIGDLLLSNSMSFGRPYILRVSGCIHDGWLVLQDYQKTFAKDYLYYILSSELVINQYISKASGSSVLNLNKELVSSVILPVPPLSEQQAIAEALSDVDAVISSLTKLINKKKNIKQGAMQELLTGKKRLEGFSGEWVENMIGDIATIRKGHQMNKDKLSDQGKYPVINGGIEPSGYMFDWNIQENTITISEGGNSCGYVNFIKTKFWSGGHCYTIHIKNNNLNNLYLYYLLKINEKRIMDLRVGSGLPNIQRNSIEEFQIRYTKDIKEQTAIANILSNMDAEIEALEQKLNKYKAIKQGMMHELLTGRIRLI
jgi:type I restriction enzyme S subunit